MLRIYELIINKFGILHHLSVSQLNRVKRLGVKPRGTHVTYSVNQRQLPPTTPQPWEDVNPSRFDLNTALSASPTYIRMKIGNVNNPAQH